MKTKEEILKIPNVRFWDDEETVDLCIDKESAFIEILHVQKCLRCDNRLMDKNEYMYKHFNEHINGLPVECSYCNQKHFVRKYFKY